MHISNFGKRGVGFVSVMIMLGLALVGLTSISGESAQKSKAKPPAEAKKEFRYAPTLAVLMVAYEGVLKNDDKTNPEMVRALKRSFASNPSARQTVAKIHKAYEALSFSDRQKIVGKELVNAGATTRLSRASLEPIFTKHFKRSSILLAEKAPSKMTAAMLKPMKMPESVRLSDEKIKIPDKLVKFRTRTLGAEAKEGSSTTYTVKYKGLYCRTEPADFGLHCEPYIIFHMQQGDSYWTSRVGPYDNVDAGDTRSGSLKLRDGTPFNQDLTIVATLFEHDLGDIDEMEEAMHASLESMFGSGVFGSLGASLLDAVYDVLFWFADLFGLDDDQIGQPQSIRFTKSFAETHKGHETAHGIEYDRYLRFTGDPGGRARQRGDFFVYLDVRQD